jgi:hypothetical protein
MVLTYQALDGFADVLVGMKHAEQEGEIAALGWVGCRQVRSARMLTRHAGCVVVLDPQARAAVGR